MFATAGLVAAPLFLDLNKFRNDFAITVKELTGQEPTIEGSVNLSFFPVPTLTMGHIEIPNAEGAQSQAILSADGVEAKFSLASIVKWKFFPSSITLLRPRIEIEKMDDGQQNWLKIITDNNKTNPGKELHIPDKIIINNGTITYRDGTVRTTIDYLSSNISAASIQGPFDITGSFHEEASNVNFSMEIGKISENAAAKIDISSDTFDLAIKGNYHLGENAEIGGNAEFKIKDISKFAGSFFSDSPTITKIQSSENITLTSDFQISNTAANLSKISINSDSIKGSGNIDVFYNMDNDNPLQWEVSMNMEKVNLDTLRKSNNAASNEDYLTKAALISSTAGSSSYSFYLPQNFSALLKISLGEITYNNDKINNLMVDTEIFDGRATIHSISAQLPGNSKFELTGNVDNNGIRPVFIGKIRAFGDDLRSALIWLYPQYSFIPDSAMKEFLFLCDISATPKILTISNIYGSVDRTLINGSLLLHPTDTTPSINAELKVDRLNFDKYNATPKIDKFANDFISSAKDLNIETSWLKTFNYKMSLTLSGDDLVYNNNTIKNISTSIGAVKGLLSIQNLNFDSDLLKLNGKIEMNLTKETPEIDINIKSNYFDTKALILKTEPDNKVTVLDDKNSYWSKDHINLLGISRFNGSINLAFNEFRHENLVLNNTSFKGDLKRDILTINDMKADFGKSGKVSVKGAAVVSNESPSISASIIINNVEISDILHAIGSKNQTTGSIYAGIAIKTFGNSLYDWANGMKADAKIATRNVVFNGIDIDEIIEQSRRLYSVIDMNTVLKEATKKGTSTFGAIDGNLTSENSILQAKDLTLYTEKSRGVFAGNISLHNFKVKGLANIDYIPEFNKKVRLGININGSLPDNITYKLDSNNLEQYITGKANK